MKKSTEQQIAALFVQAMRTALALIDEKKPTRKPRAKFARYDASPLGTGIYYRQSPSNPYHCQVWNGEKNVYLDAFPGVATCKRAQKAFLAGKPITTGTKGRALRLVKAA